MPNYKKSQKTIKPSSLSPAYPRRGRIIFNTTLLLLSALVSGYLTYRAYSIAQNASRMLSHSSLSDSPALCYDTPTSTIREHGYICTTQYDAATDKNISVGDDVQQLTLYLNERITFSGAITNSYLGLALTYLGAALTLTQLIAAIIYFNHNRE